MDETETMMIRQLRLCIERFLRDQAGVNYTMQVTIALPLLVLMTATFIEATLLANAKTGVSYAATTAARSATVWWPAQDLSDNDTEEERRRIGRIHLAAVNALAPFASGREVHAGLPGGEFEYPADAPLAWAQAYREAGGDHDLEYLARKWRYAAAATTVSIEPLRPDAEEEIPLTEEEDDVTFNSVLKVTVEYKMPFHTPGVGRLFGVAQGGGHYTRLLTSTVYLEKEGPKTEDFRLGFKDYYEVDEPDEVFESENAADGDPNLGRS